MKFLIKTVESDEGNDEFMWTLTFYDDTTGKFEEITEFQNFGDKNE